MTARPHHHTELLYQLRRLANAGTVLQLGAHPDDEDFGTMAFTARHDYQRAVYWSATRGEGGQNRLGAEQGPALGLYRTWESLNARAIDGGEAIYGPFIDFGYSKDAHDTLAKWGAENVVREIVRAIRRVQPLILVSRWNGENPAMDQHGHHQAIGQAARLAWKACGDPAAFPELDLPPWQPCRMYLSTQNDMQPGEQATLGQIMPEWDKAGYVRVDTSAFDPLAGRSHQETGWMAINSHKTQGLGFVPEAHTFYYYYELLHSKTEAPGAGDNWYAGLDSSLAGLVDHALAGDQLNDDTTGKWRDELLQIVLLTSTAIESYQLADYADSGNSLLEALELLHHIDEPLSASENPSSGALRFAIRERIVRFETLAGALLGLRLETNAAVRRLVPGQSFAVDCQLWNGLKLDIKVKETALEMPTGWSSTKQKIKDPSGLSTSFEVQSGPDAPLTTPYWLENPHTRFLYNWPGSAEVGLPLQSAELHAICEVSYLGHRLTLRSPVCQRSAFPGGFRELPVAVLPPVSLQPERERFLLPADGEQRELQIRLVASNNATTGETSGALHLDAPDGWTVSPASVDISLSEERDTQTQGFVVTIPADVSAGAYTLSAHVEVNGRRYDRVLQAVRMGAPGIPKAPDASSAVKEAFVLSPATIDVRLFDVSFPTQLKYAYISGMAEGVLETLHGFDLDIRELTDEELNFVDFAQFDGVVVGPNAYTGRAALAQNSHRLLEYAREGGTLIVQFQGYEFEGGGHTPFPFEFNHPHDRVTDEFAEVTVLRPDHSVFRLPNTISTEDFSGWVHDRGMYFFGEWDERYEALLACHDHGEDDRRGGLMLSSFGRGTYIYCAYSMHRQLPTGVAGAFRLFANLLAVPLVRIMERAEALKTQAMFEFMDDGQLETVARLMARESFSSGAFIAHEGEPADRMFLILEGEVEIVDEASGEIAYVSVPGELVGELGVLGGFARVKSMRARGDVESLVIDGGDFKSLLHQHPAISDQLIRMLVNKLAGQ